MFGTCSNGRKIRKLLLKLKMKSTFSMERREVIENECFSKIVKNRQVVDLDVQKVSKMIFYVHTKVGEQPWCS